MKNPKRSFWREWILTPAIFFLVIAPLKSAVGELNWVPSGSMKPSILEGEMVLVNKLAYDLKIPFTTQHLAAWGDPARGDVVVFFSPADGMRLVKRVIGLPGDRIELRNEMLYVNDFPQSYSPVEAAPFAHDVDEDANPAIAVEHLTDCDHYVMALPARDARRTFGPLVVPPGEYFMMGDSRDNSNDSRFIGSIPRRNIVGRVPRVVLSFDPRRYYLPRPQRFLQSLKFEKLADVASRLED